MKRLALVSAVLVLVVACSSTDDSYGRRGGYGGPRDDGGGVYAANRPTPGGLDMLPPADWWHQPMLAAAVKLTPDQIASLDKIAQDNGSSDVSKLENDMTIAMRDLRTQLDAAQPASADIVAAGNRIRSLRDAMFDRQLQMLAAERTVLSLDQWQTLQQQLRERRQQRNNDYGPRRGGRGMGGRGRWPGY